MKKYIVNFSALAKVKTFSKMIKLGVAIALFSGFSPASKAQQIVNGSFENGFTGWVTTPGNFIVGNPPNNPIGTRVLNLLTRAVVTSQERYCPKPFQI